jgi:hypothetical protein
MAAMRRHPGSAHVQQHGCLALASIVRAHPANAAAAARDGCLVVLTTAMKAHANAEELQRNGCLALMSMAQALPGDVQRDAHGRCRCVRY